MQNNQQDFKPSDVLGSLFQLAGQVCIGFVRLVFTVGASIGNLCGKGLDSLPENQYASKKAD